MRKLISTLTLCFCILLAEAQEKGLTLGPMFTDHVILQQGQSVPVWGTAAPKANVTVTFGKVKVKAKADADGNWKTVLPAQTATFEGKPLVVKAGKEQILLSDVVVGEVWVAAGQSNMEYTMKKYPTYQNPYKGEDLAAKELQKPENPKIRVFTCPRKGKGSGWQPANGASLAMASAPGYFCVKNLQDSLQVPVGVISTAVGGTMIETWRKDGEWYKKMIAPYVPYTVKGILWYQGENNCTNREHHYASMFKAMAEEWRQEWGGATTPLSSWREAGSEALPFLTVMLAPHIYSDRHHRKGVVDAEELPRFRMQQMACLDSVSNTEIIFNPDLVDDLFDIHHSYKWEVGRRLAVLALNKVYGRTELEWSGPRADAVSLVKGKHEAMLKVHFTHVGTGLKKTPKDQERMTGSMLRWFEVAGSDGIWHAATAYVDDSVHVMLSSPSVQHPVSVRYLWHETATSVDLRNSYGLPAFPFIMSLYDNPALKGKRIGVLGDSYVRNHREPVENTWHYKFAQKHGMQYFNYGRNGNCIALDLNKWGTGMYKRYREMNDSLDYVLVIAGHNDASRGRLDSIGIDTFRERLGILCSGLKEKYPQSTILFFTPWTCENFIGSSRQQVIDAMLEVCGSYGIPVFDAARRSNICADSELFRQQYFQGGNGRDTAHLNARGHDLFLPLAEQFISQYTKNNVE